MEKRRETKNRFLICLLSVIEKVSELTGKAASFLIIPVLLIALTLIFFRRLLPYTGITLWTAEDEELPTFAILLTVYFTLGAGYALHTHSFINYNLLQNRISPKANAWLELIIYIFFFVTFGALFWLLAGDLLEAITEGIGKVEGLGTPTLLMRIEAYLQLLTLISWPAGILLLLLEGFSESILAFFRISKGGQPGER